MVKNQQELGERLIFKTDTIAYYSCRAPNGDFVLLAKCQDYQLKKKLEAIRGRQADFLEEVDLGQYSDCRLGECSRRRDCIAVKFLPFEDTKIRRQTSENDLNLYLRYDCFEFGNLVSMAELAEHYCVSLTTAYRFTMSLLVMTDRMTRLNLLFTPKLENLLVDLSSTFMTLIDWSNVEILDEVQIWLVMRAHRAIGKIILKLIDAELQEGQWHSQSNHEIYERRALLDFLQSLIEQEYEPPDRLDDLLDYIRAYRIKIQGLPEKLVDLARKDKIQPGQPPYRLIPRK